MKKLTITKASDEKIEDDAMYQFSMAPFQGEFMTLTGRELKSVLKKLSSFDYVVVIDNQAEKK